MSRLKILVSAAPLLLAGVLAGGGFAPGPRPCIAIGERAMQIAAAPWQTGLHVAFTDDPASRQGRKGEMPPLRIALVLIFLAAGWAFDGVNSFARLIPALPHLYTSQNWLRLLTGFGMGLGIASVLIPVFNQSVWIDYQPVAAMGQWRHLFSVAGLLLLSGAGIASENPLLAYPLAVLSGLGVLVMLTSVYTVVWVLLSRTENRYHTIRQLWLPLLAGFTTAMLQISLIDAGRFWLTGTWAGFPLPG